eukprot:TRINITY_DN6363_c0_g1_i1.p2 TRINITY_DN6363_c0_g1~~TRINITY_DN6363_c0_g1_i1.p2  ORF type:complete len:546 (-),score=185.89 TRINITY_DN6363_c0_g1_i1:193-1830(-)
MGLLTESYILSAREPAVVLSVDERARIDLPPFTFCVQGPAFATIDARGADGERLGAYRGTIGRPLFVPQYVHLATPPGEPTAGRITEPLAVDAAGRDGVLRELADPAPGCSAANGSLSVKEADVCFSCYEMWEEHQLFGGGTLSANLQSSIDVSFLVYPAYAACLADPDDVPRTSIDHLREVVANATALATLTARGALTAAAEPPVSAADTASLTSVQLCNVVFFSGVFYPLRRGSGAAYTRGAPANGSTSWTPVGSPDQFLTGRHVGSGDAIDVHILPTVVAGGTPVRNKAISHATLPGIPVGAAKFGLLTQVLLMKRIFQPGVQGPGSVLERRYEARVAGYPSAKPKVDAYVQTEVSIAMETFLVESFDRQSEYTFVQYLEQLTGYTANFFDISVFTLIVVPIIFAFHKRDKARAEAAEAAEAAARAADGPDPAAALGATPLLPPMANITPGGPSASYRRRRLPSSPASQMAAPAGGGARAAALRGGGRGEWHGVPGVGTGGGGVGPELGGVDSALWAGAGGRRGGAPTTAPRRRDSSDDSLV